MEGKIIAEWILGIVTVLSGFMVAFSKRIVHAGFSLLFTFLGVAGLYVMLSADFLAATQVLVYIGGILVLILFGILLTHRIQGLGLVNPYRGRFYWPYLAAFGIYLVLTYVVLFTQWPTMSQVVYENTTHKIGVLFMTDYLLPFETISVLLLGALIGALVIAREENKS